MNNIFSFENGISQNINSINEISISEKHYKDGKASLKWDIEKNGQLIINTDVNYEAYNPNAISKAISTFVFWVYQEKTSSDKLRVTFGNENRACCSFDMNMNFTGWRTVWVPFEEMNGEPEPNMNRITFTMDASEPHTLYLDQIIPLTKVDSRHHVRDAQVPFVNTNADKAVNSHWMSLYRFSELYREKIENVELATVSDECLSSFKILENRLDEILMSHRTYPLNGNTLLTWEDIDDLKDDYATFKINKTEDNITGATIKSRYHEACYPKDINTELQELTNGIDISFCAKWMLDAAYMWQVGTATQKDVIEKMYINLFLHLVDEGWDNNSGLGTVHHLGYPMRNYYKSIYLMKEPLKKYGLLQKASDIAKWYSGIGRILRSDEEIVGESLDVFNTLLYGMVISVLTEENNTKKHLLLQSLKHWLDVSLMPAPGLKGPLKIDGSTFHHCKHYPAYTVGGLTGITPIVYVLSKTPYAIDSVSHKLLDKALLTMRFYCNHFAWPVAMSARHPVGDGDRGSLNTLEPFYYMALAGDPDSNEPYDEKMVEALLRLAKHTSFKQAEKFIKEGYKEEKTPNGNIALGYACCSLHRRDEWLASVCGHSRYIWGNETYVANNLYGRYVAYGNLQILGNGNPIDNKHSGYVQEGWDWNFWPGTTTVALPLNEMRSNVCNVDRFSGFEEMLLSDEAFVGGSSIDGNNGMFAMKLHSHAKYDATQRANKSYFFFGNKIICVGSGIENENPNGNTYTTLFQNYLVNDTDPIYINNNKKTELNYTETFDDSLYLYDNCGNAYYVPEHQKVTVTRLLQTSFDQNTSEKTSNLFARALIEHGSMPKDEEYEYSIFPAQNRLEAIPARADIDKLYKVLAKSRDLHCVYDCESNTYAYIVWDSKAKLNFANITEVSSPMLVSEKSNENTIEISMCDPDLRLYEGQEEDQLYENGLQKEVSLYSRKWLGSKSIKKTISVTLNGKWELAVKDNENIQISFVDNKTIVSAVSTDGFTYRATLIRR